MSSRKKKYFELYFCCRCPIIYVNLSVFISRANTTFRTQCLHLSLVQVSAVLANISYPSQHRYPSQYQVTFTSGSLHNISYPSQHRYPSQHQVPFTTSSTLHNIRYPSQHQVPFTTSSTLHNIRYPSQQHTRISSPSKLQHRSATWIIIHHMYLLYTSLHILQRILTSDISIIIYILYTIQQCEF